MKKQFDHKLDLMFWCLFRDISFDKYLELEEEFINNNGIVDITFAIHDELLNQN